MANQYVNKVAVNGKTVLDLSADTVYPGMLAKGITAHDKSGAKITGTLEVPAAEERTVELSMPSGNQVIQPTSGKVMSKVTVQKPATLVPENIKKDVVIGGVTGTLEGGGSVSVQPSKSVSITQNGTTTVTPDTGYDALSKVDVTVDVAGSGGVEYKVINMQLTDSTPVKEFTLTHNLGRKPKFVSFAKGAMIADGKYIIQWFQIVEYNGNIRIKFATSTTFSSRDPQPAVKEIPSDGFAGKPYYIQVGNANESTISFKFGETSSFSANFSSGSFIVG